MNKHKVITTFILLLLFTYAKGQDKIITTQNDTIFCRIVSITTTHIQYEQKDDKQNLVGKFIPIEQVAEYIPSSPLRETTLGTLISKQPKEPFDRWRVGIEGGGAHLLSSFSNIETNMQYIGIFQSNIDDYIKKIRNGIYMGADVHYFITPFLGVGLKCSMFATSAQLDYNLRLSDYYYVSPDYSYGYSIPTYYSMNEKDKIYVNYIGPSVVFQHWLDKNRKFRFNAGLSIGYAHYREEDRFDPYQFINPFDGTVSLSLGNTLAEGNTWGGNIRLSFEYYPLSRLSIGANVGGSLATFKTIKVSNKDTSITQDLDSNNHIDMSYLDYSISVRFHF